MVPQDSNPIDCETESVSSVAERHENANRTPGSPEPPPFDLTVQHAVDPRTYVPAPPMNTSHMPQYVGKRGSLIGQVKSIDASAGTAEMIVSDGVEIRILFNTPFEPKSKFIEVIGAIVEDKIVQMERFCELGNNLDLTTVEGTIAVIHDSRFKDVFFPFRSK
ncbi:hypothetical protein VNI00_016967 [Paramarasmius palmivorus]|uniref:Replication factor A protein 3 n=1 Tax=Paramarasmius palmivorus TaxID=297713 RepID=A0AAW0B9B0_9AGAR